MKLMTQTFNTSLTARGTRGHDMYAMSVSYIGCAVLLVGMIVSWLIAIGVMPKEPIVRSPSRTVHEI